MDEHPLDCYSANVVIFFGKMNHSNVAKYDLLLIFLYNSLGAVEVESFVILPLFFWVNMLYKIYLYILKKQQTIHCVIDKIIKVANLFVYVTSSIYESLGYKSVIVMLHLQSMYFTDSVV